MSKTIRVLLVDDSPALRAGLRTLLDQTPDITVGGEAWDVVGAVAQIEALLPDVALLDCRLREEVGGSMVAAEIRRRGLPTRVLAFSAHLEDQHIRNMIEAGAIGYLLKEESAEVIVAAIRAAARGEGWFSPRVVSRMAAWAGGESLKPTGPTRRELEILELIAKGWTNAHIAKALNIAERTVAFHVESLLAKLSASNRTEAVVEAIRRGWLKV